MPKSNPDFFLLVLLFFLTQIGLSQDGRFKHSDEVFFEFGKYDLSPFSDSILSNIAGIFFESNSPSISITAHTDSIGSIKNNVILSEKRAGAVRSFLSEKGIPDSLMAINVFGESQPATSNNSDVGRQLNLSLIHI